MKAVWQKNKKRDLGHAAIKKGIKLGFKLTEVAVGKAGTREQWGDGCCAVAAFVVDNTVYIANLGDSRFGCSKLIQNHDHTHELIMFMQYKTYMQTKNDLENCVMALRAL